MSASLVKQDIKALRRQELDARIDKIKARGLKHAAEIMKPGSEAGERQARLQTNRDKFAMLIWQAEMADRREHQVTERQLGVLVLRDRLDRESWEREAQRVDAKVVDVEVK